MLVFIYDIILRLVRADQVKIVLVFITAIILRLV